MNIVNILQARPDSATISDMKRGNQEGSINMLLIPLIAVVLLLLGAAYFGYWAYSSRQDYKDHSDQKSAAAVTAALKTEDAKKDAQFAQEEKDPLKTYNGPAAYGSLIVRYPKTWSGYVNEDSNGQTNVDGYFYPGVVPDTQSQTSNFALRVQVVSQSYSSVLQTFGTYITAKKLTSTPYSLPKVPSVVGVRLDGQIGLNKQGSMIVLPLRSETLKIWTESSQFMDDFNNNILPNLRFSP